MRQISMVNALSIFKTNFYLVIRNNLLLAIAYLFIVPIVRGTANLDAVHSAACLEQSVIHIGIIILVPLNAAEQSKALQETVYTKKVQQWTILLMRLVMAYITLIILTGAFAGIMIWNNCKFPYIPYVAGTVISEAALGSVGLFAAILSNSAVVGYLVSMGYFLFNFLGNISSTSILNLFSMETNIFTAKIWLLAISTLLIVIALIYVKKKK